MTTTANGSAAMVVRSEGPALAKAATRAFEPETIREAMELAQVLVASKLLPRSVATAEAAFTIIATGRELGLTAMQSLRSIHVIEGKPTLSADLIAALVKSRADVCEWFRLVESSNERATYQTKRRGEPEPTVMTFTMGDAQQAGVAGKDNWRKYPAAMLRARCITALARAVYPDLAMGIYDPDELGGEVAPETGPAPAVQVVVASPAPREPVPPGMFEFICTQVDAAETGPALNEIAKKVEAMFKKGDLSQGHRDAIKAAVQNKRGLLGKDAPPAPGSAPKVEVGQ